jgi:multiple sugar transport system permease protein
MINYLKVKFCLALFLFILPYANILYSGEIIENKNYKGAKVLIKYSQYGEAGEVEYTKKIIHGFVNLFPNIKVEINVYPWGQYWTKLQIQSASGLSPDVMMLHSNVMAVWAERGAILPIDDYIKKSKINLNDYYKIGIKAGNWKGKQYTFPLDIPTRALIYKKNKLKQCGISEENFPKTNKPLSWIEFINLAKRLTVRNDEGQILQYGMVGGLGWDEPMFRMFGANIFDRQIDPQKTEIIKNDSLLRGMFEVYRIQYAERFHLGDATIRTGNFAVSSLLYNDNFVMTTDGPWILRNLSKDNFDYGVTPFPRVKNPVLVLDINSAAIYSGSKHPDKAWELIKFLASYSSQIIYGKRLRGVPSLIKAKDGLINNDYGAKYCDAFLYDLETASTNIITDNSYLVPIQESWRLTTESILDKKYDEELNKLRAKFGKIPEEEYYNFVKKMENFVYSELKKQLPLLELQYNEAFKRGKTNHADIFVKNIAPVILLIIIIIAGWFYIYSIKRNQPAKISPLRTDNISGFISISPWIAGFILFLAGPILAAIYFSFTEWNLISSPKWVGIKNYIDLLNDTRFFIGLERTFSYTIYAVPLTILGGLFTAALLTNNIRGINFFKSLFYFPSLFTGAAIAVLWVNIFNKEYGVINYIISFFGISPINWLDANNAFTTVILMNIFWIGSSMIVYYAGMKQIPISLYEAAEIDGAGYLRKFFHITIPALAPVILFIVIITTIGSFQIFTPALFFAESSARIGDPSDSLRFYSVNIYDEAFNGLRMGKACSYAVILFIIIFIITYLQLKFSKKFIENN